MMKLICIYIGGILLSVNTNAQTRIIFRPLYKQMYLQNSESSTDSITVFKLYISSLQLWYQDGSQYEEPNSYHLLDLEQTESFKINLKAPEKAIAKITFNLGIDSLTNVSGALDGDLDPSRGMYWAWQSGYINFKLEGKSAKCMTAKNEFSFHIGGYLTPYYALRRIQVPIKTQKKEGVLIDINIDKIFEKLDLANTHTIMIPGKEAMQVADCFPLLFYNK